MFRTEAPFETVIKQGQQIKDLFEKAAVLDQLKDSYEFLYNKLGSDHPETWDCWQQYQRVLRWES